jgi:hypothetical protein
MPTSPTRKRSSREPVVQVKLRSKPRGMNDEGLDAVGCAYDMEAWRKKDGAEPV